MRGRAPRRPPRRPQRPGGIRQRTASRERRSRTWSSARGSRAPDSGSCSTRRCRDAPEGVDAPGDAPHGLPPPRAAVGRAPAARPLRTADAQSRAAPPRQRRRRRGRTRRGGAPPHPGGGRRGGGARGGEPGLRRAAPAPGRRQARRRGDRAARAPPPPRPRPSPPAPSPPPAPAPPAAGPGAPSMHATRRRGVGQAPPSTAGSSRSSACLAASCSAAFFELPAPVPASAPSMTAAHVKRRSCGGPSTSSTE